MTAATWFMRVVTQFSTALFAIEWLDRGINVQDPWCAQRCSGAFLQMRLQPSLADLSAQSAQRTSHGIFTDDLIHPQYLRTDHVAPQTRDV